MFEDLASSKDTSPLLSSLKPCDEARLAEIQRIHPNAPSDYLEFLRLVGAGNIGEAQYILYSGLVEPQDVYGDTPPSLEHVVLFGDDLQGFCAGFDTASWEVVEIDPTNMELSQVADSFEQFIRNRLSV